MRIAQYQYEFLKDQMNFVQNKRQDGIKLEGGGIINHVHHKYIGDEYKNLFANIFKYEFVLTNTVNTYLENYINVDDRCLISRNPLKI